jgi:hypothetical protein
VKKTIFAVAALAIAAAVPAAALDTSSIPTFTRATFNLAEAYPCTISTPPTAGVDLPRVFIGRADCPTDNVQTFNGASPGVLCLDRDGTLILNVNCFATIPGDVTAGGAAGDGAKQFGPCVVQAFQLTKEVPGSFKCPDVFGLPHFDKDGNLIPFRFFQFGSGVRTWWSLNFTQPGTRFILDVISVCRTAAPVFVNGFQTVAPGPPLVHRDRWIWRVVANVDTLNVLVDLMHGGAISTLEVPCILGEDMFDALKKAVKSLKSAIDSKNQTDIGNAIFDMEALIVANCLFVEVLNPLVAFPGPAQFNAPNIQPPGNLAQTVFFGKGSAVAGILDTIENPCCCKLLVDLEWIAIRQGIVGQTPTLPTF